MFQSPSGVLGVCRWKKSGRSLPFLEVSVPFRGFRGLQVEAATSIEDLAGVFQSPSGVLGVCRHLRVKEGNAKKAQVSVPFRGFRGLQAYTGGKLVKGEVVVSVPFRGFRGLQVVSRRCSTPSTAWFQSPSGVLGVCRVDKSQTLTRDQAETFQSPSGVLGVCRHWDSNPEPTG